MKKFRIIFSLALMFLTSQVILSQQLTFVDFSDKEPNYQACAAILYYGNVLGDEYFIEDKPRVGLGMSGPLTMATVLLDETGEAPIMNIKFQVGIKNKRTNTFFMVTKAPVEKIDFEEILELCEAGTPLFLWYRIKNIVSPEMKFTSFLAVKKTHIIILKK